MKKTIFSLLFISLLTNSLFIGCAKKTLQDGIYTAEDVTYDAHGWKAYVTITISNGKIIDTKFEYLSEEGTSKSENTSYAEKMATETGITPNEYMTKYSKQLIDKQNLEEIEVISGATTSQKDFKALATAAIEAAKSGNTDTIQVELYK